MTISHLPSSLPVKRDMPSAHLLSVISALLMAALSLIGLIFPNWAYPSDELKQTFFANDIVNLVIGLPILLGSLWLARRGRLIGLLLWPGALLYVVYNYTAFVFGSPFGWIKIGALALVLISTVAIINLLINIDEGKVKAQLDGAVPVKTSGWVLAGFGIVFVFRAISMFVEASVSQIALPVSEIGVLSADLILSLIWIAGGAALLRKLPLGYVTGLGLLFVGSMLFIGLILFLVLQPILTNAPFDATGVIVVAIMGLVCFIPFGLFARGVISSSRI